MINYNTIIVFDFETFSKNPHTTQPLQLAACAVHSRKLEVIDQFQVYMKPKTWDGCEDEALAINNITRDFIEEKGVDQQLAFEEFTNWVGKYNPKKSFFTAPVPAGMNIKGFDMHIINRLCKLYGPMDKERGEQSLFSNRDQIDLLNILFMFFESDSSLAKYNMDTLREYFGLSKEGGHNAITDVKQTAALIIRFMKFARNCVKGRNFEGTFKNV